MNIDSCTLRILSNQQTLGTGFLVGRDLVVTCAHVIEAAAGGTIQAQMLGQSEILYAQVIPDLYRDPDHGDIAFLRLAHPPGNLKPLRLGEAQNSRSGNPFQAFGYPRVGAVEGIYARGEILGRVTENGQDLLQLRSSELKQGHSGAPVLDERRGIVIGMVVSVYQSDSSGRLRDTAFAIPSETLWQVCSEIKPLEICPYLGLQSFTVETAQYFFGREALADKLLGVLRGGSRFLAVLGPSGSGKSSVVQAGVLRALKEDRLPGSEKWAQITMRPADDPFQQMRAEGLDPINIDQYLKSHNGYERVVIFLDQFEELFTFCPDELRGRFVRDLVAALENSKLILIISMRDDFYSAFHAKAAPLAQSEHLKIENVPGTLGQKELVAMIERPAESVGLELEEGLTELILNDVATQDETRSAILPLLEFALTQLWVKRREGLLTHERYNEIGGVTGSLARWADDAYDALVKEDQTLAESLLTDLVYLGDKTEGLPDTRRRRALEEFDDPTRRVIKHFADRRLLVTNRETVELIHDTMLREWGRFGKWLDENRDFLTWRQKLAERYEEWKAGRAELLRGRELAIAQDYRAQRSKDLDELGEYISRSERQVKQTNLLVFGLVVFAFLILGAFGVFAWDQRNNVLSAQATTTAGIATQAEALAHEEQALQTAQVESTRAAAESTRVAHAQGTALANEILATQGAQQADQQEFLKISENLSSVAGSTIDTNYTRGLLLGVESYRLLEVHDLSQGQFPDALPALLDKMPRGFIRTLHLFSGPVRKILYAPNGKRMVSLSDTIDLWNTEVPSAPTLVKDWEHPTSKPSDVTFSPDSKLMAVGYEDGHVDLWAVSTSKVTNLKTLNDFSSQSAAQIKVAISADSSILAVSGNKTIRIWDISNPSAPQSIGRVAIPHEISDAGVDINYLGFVPESSSHFLVSGGEDGYLHIWNLTKYSNNPPRFEGNPFPFDTGTPVVAISSKHLLVADKRFIRVFFLLNDDREFAGAFSYAAVHQGVIEKMILSPDSKKLYTTAQDGMIAEWDLTDPRHMKFIRKFGGPLNRLSSMAFHPGGDFIAVGDNNSSIGIWNLPQQEMAHIWDSQILNGANITDVAYSPKWNFLAVGNDKGEIVLQDISDLFDIKERRTTSIRNPIRHIAFNPAETALLFLGDFTSDAFEPAGYRRDLDRLEYNTNEFLFGTNTAEIFAAGDTYILAGDSDHGKISIFHWDISKLDIIKGSGPIRPNECPFRDVAFARNGSLAAVATCNVQLWDFSDGQEPSLIAELEALEPGGVALNAEGSLLASANGNNSISIWKIVPDKNNEATLLATRSAHASEITSVSISPDGKTLASGGADRTVILWDITNPEHPSQRVVLSGHTSAVLNGGLFFKDSNTLISASKNEVILWDIDPQSWIKKACDIAGQNLSQQEWQQFVGSVIPYHETCPGQPVPEN